jgi:hypothetical protein
MKHNDENKPDYIKGFFARCQDIEEETLENSDTTA